MEDLSIRPGFNLHAEFRGHLSHVRRVTYNARTKQFLSMDEHCLKAWSLGRDGGARVQHDVQFPGHQQNFITSMVLSQELSLLFTACLDDNLRLYNERLRLKSCMPWSNGVVREMVFYEPRSLLVTAGSYGVKVWECLLDYEAFRTDKTSDMFDVPKIKDGSVLPWCFGKYQHVRLHCNLHVPGARMMGSTGVGPTATNAPGGGGGGAEVLDGGGMPGSVSGGDGSEVIHAPWCDRIVLHESTAMVLAMFHGSVYGFDIMNGTCLSSYTALYTQPVTSCVFVPDNDLLYTTAMDTSAVLWRIPRGCDAQRFKQFGRSSAPMTVVVQDPDNRHVLTTALDGSVVLWDMDTLVPVFRMKLSRTPVSTAFYKPNAFFLATDSEVKLFTITHLFEAWMDCNSPVVNLRSVSYGLVLAEFADSSVRLLDAYESSHRPDKAVVTSMPQLSSQQLVAAAVSLTAARLLSLLGDGAVHMWQLHLRRPPSFLAAWTHLSREACVSVCYLDAGVLPHTAAVRMALPYDHNTGFTHDHVALGTASGDCLIVDITTGHISFRFPAFKHQPLQLLAADLDRCLLITVSRTSIKIWNLQDVRCVHEMCTTKPISRVELLEGRAVIGSSSGSVHVMELSSGISISASVAVDHLDAVTGLGASVYLQHVVTGSRDSHIKVFDRDKRFKRSIYVGGPVAAVTYLNDRGDILVALGNRLVVIRVDKYDKLPSAPKESIYDELRGQGRTPRTLLRAMQSRLQRLSRCKVPLQLYSAWLEEEDRRAAASGGGPDGTPSSASTTTSPGQILSRRRTPPLRRLRSGNSEYLGGETRPVSSGSGGGGGVRGMSPGTTAGGGISPLVAGMATAAVSGMGVVFLPGSASGGSRPGSSALRGVLKTPVTGGEGGGQRPEVLPTSRDMSSRGRNRSVQWRQHPQQDEGSEGGGAVEGEAEGPAGGNQHPNTARPGSGSGHGGSPAPAGLSPRLSPRSVVRPGADGGGGDADDSSGGGGGSDSDQFKSEDEEEGLVIAREMYPLKFKFNLQKEKMRIDRLNHGLPLIHPRPAHNGRPDNGTDGSRDSTSRTKAGPGPPSREGEGEGERGAQAAAPVGAGGGSRGVGSPPHTQPVFGGVTGALMLRLATFQNVGLDAGEEPNESSSEEDEEASTSDEDNDGSHSSLSVSLSGSESTIELPISTAGLSTGFRRTLPVIASPSAFFDGHLPPEALPRRLKKAPPATRQHKQQQPMGGGRSVGGDSAAAIVAETSEWPPADGGSSSKMAVKKKTKKKKKKRRRRRAPGDGDIVQELKSRLDYEIRNEVKKYEKHQTVQRLAGAIFLPRLGGTATASAAAFASRASLTVPVMPGSRGNTEPGATGTSGATAAASDGDGTCTGPGTSGGVILRPSHTPSISVVQVPQGAHLSGPSFKTMLKGLGMRCTVADMARMMQDPSRFVVAQDQDQVLGQGMGPSKRAGHGYRANQYQGQGQGISPGKDERRVMMAAAGADVGVEGVEGLKSRGSGAVVARGDYGFKAFMEIHDKK